MISDNNAKKLISIFESAGHKAYAVGGCVRDSLMGLPFSDVDIAVSCPPLVTESVLIQNGIRFVETGLQHGTVTAVLASKPYEITTFRTESGYADNRHPDSVTFVNDIESDLSRRDFTVNAMAYSDSDGLVDVFGGKKDINNKIIRAVGDADTRFNEDALRILRALRFSSTLDFSIEKDTSLSVVKNKSLLKNVARERITAEIEKLVCGKGASRIISEYYPVFNVIFNFDFPRDLYVNAAAKISRMPCDVTLRLAMLFDCLGTDLSHHLVLSKQQLLRIKNVREFEKVGELSENQVRHIMSRVGFDFACDIFIFNFNEKALLHAKDIEKSGSPYLISHLLVNGNDLMKVGFVGKEIKTALKKALCAVIDGKVQNSKNNILDYLLNK